MTILENSTLWIRDCRIAYPSIAKPSAASPGAEEKFSAIFLLEPEAVEWTELAQIVKTIASEKWGDAMPAVMQNIKSDKRLRCYGEGDEKVSQKTGQVYPGFAGKKFISASNRERPRLHGADAAELPPTAPINELFRGGNYVDAIVRIWLQDNQYGRAVRASLEGIQYKHDGEAIGGSASVDTGAIFQPSEDTPVSMGDGDTDDLL